MASGPITSWQIDGETMETVTDFISLGSKITADGDCAMKLKDPYFWKESCDKPQFSSVAQLCPTLCDPTDCSMPGLPVHHHSWSLLKLMSIEWVIPSNHLILCRPLLLLPSVFPSIRVFSNESVLRIRWQSIGASALASVLPMNIQD